MPTEGEVSVGAVAIDFEGNTEPAERSAQGLAQKITEIGNRLGSGSNSGFVAWGTTASRSIGNVSNSIGSLNRTFGESAPLSAFTGTLDAMSVGFDNLARKEEAAESAGRHFISLGPALTGLGVIMTGLGGAFTAIATPLQHAQAELQTAIKNTGSSLSEYQGQMDSAASAGAKFGFTQSDVQKALAELTVETKNPAEALRELNMTETLAMARHTDLGHAARYMGQAHAGMFRVFRQFGIEIAQVKNPEKALESAHKSLATATDNLKNKQQSLNDFEARASADLQKRQEEAANKVQETQQSMADAATRYQDLQEQYAQQEQQRIETTTQAAQDAAQRKMDADQAVADLEADLSRTSAKGLDDKEALTNAEARMNQDRIRVAQTSGAAQQSAIQQLASSEAEYHKLKRDQAASQEADQDKLAKAKQTEVDATVKLGEANKKAADARKGLTPSEQQTLNKAQEDQVKTARAYQSALQQQAAAQTLTLSQQQEQARLTAAVADEQAKVKTATDAVTTAQANQDAANKAFHQLEQQFMDREKGLLQARANTWTGHIAAIKAHVIDFFQTVASHSAGVLTTLGIVAMSMGGVMQIGRGIRGAAQRVRGRTPGGPADVVAGETEEVAGEAEKAKTAFDPLAQGAKKAAEDVKGNLSGVPRAIEDVEGETAGKVGRISGLFGRIGGVVRGIPAGFSAMAGGVRLAMTSMLGFITSPVGLIILAIGALILIGYEIVTHWKTISHDLEAAWNALFAAGKAVFGAIEGAVKWAFNEVKGHFLEIIGFITLGPFGVMLGWIIQHWSAVWGAVVQVGRDAKNLILDGIKLLVDGVLSGIDDLLKGMGHLPGPFGAPFRDAAKSVDDFKKSVNNTLDALKSDGQKKAKDAGTAMGQGLNEGIAGAGNAIQAAGAGMAANAAQGAKAHAEVRSPSALFAREVGHPIAQGMALGITRGADAVLQATRTLIRNAQVGANASTGFQPSGGVIPSRTTHIGGPTGNNRDDLNPDTSRGRQVIHYEPHFHREIDPQHVLHEFTWRDVNA